MKNPVSRYLDEIIDYGVIPTTRRGAIADMQSQSIAQPCIDRWLQGQELMASIRRRQTSITVKLFLLKTEANLPNAQDTSNGPATNQHFTTTAPQKLQPFVANDPKPHPQKPKKHR